MIGPGPSNRSILRAFVFFLCLTLILCGPNRATGETADDAQPVVTFTFDFPGSEPDHYVLAVRADGHATYSSTGKLSNDSEGGQNFQLEFTVSEANRSRIFDLTKKARYFDGELDSRKKNLASTGVKTLSYKDPQRTRQASYNYSLLPAVQDLTQLFQGLSATMEFGHRLEYYHHYQKLALDDETKHMELAAKANDLVELQALTPVLQQIATDNSVINVVRARVQRLLERAGQTH